MFRIIGILCAVVIATAAANKYLPEQIRQSLYQAFDQGVSKVGQYLPDSQLASANPAQADAGAAAANDAQAVQLSLSQVQTDQAQVNQAQQLSLDAQNAAAAAATISSDASSSAAVSDAPGLIQQGLADQAAGDQISNDLSVAAAIPEPLAQRSVLPPFRSQQSAQGFAAHLSKLTEHKFYVEPVNRNFQVQFDYQGEAELILLKQQLLSKAGIKLP